MSWLYLVSCWLHVMAAVAWLGAAVFIVVAVVPAMRRIEERAQAASLMRAMTQPLRWLGAGALLLFFVTGSYNLQVRFGQALADSDFWNSRVGLAVAAKLALFGLIVAVAALHDLWLGPKASAAAAEDPNADATRRLRQQARFCGRLNLILGLLMVALGVLIVRPGW